MMKRCYLIAVLFSIALIGLAGCPKASTDAAKGDSAKSADSGAKNSSDPGKSDGATSDGADSDGATSGGATSDGAASDSAASDSAASDSAASDSAASDGAASDGAEVSGGDADVALSPKTMTIQFVCAHTDKSQPDRKGTFGTFSGQASIQDGALASISIDIDTASLSTEFDKLTAHLKSAEFFNVNEHPKATFKSTAIEDAGDGKVNITGDFTLLDTTKSIMIPATVSTDDGLSLAAQFTIDRAAYGMTQHQDSVEKEVQITVTTPK